MTLIRSFKATLPRLDAIFSAPYFFSKVKHLYPLFTQENFFYTDQKPALYIYRQKDKHGTQIGLLTLSHLEDYLNGDIVRHEDTLATKERKMMRLYEERQAVIKPVLLTYPVVQSIQDFIEKYSQQHESFFELNFKAGLHTLWRIDKKKDQKFIIESFKKYVPKTYIADGHHRAKTSANWRAKYASTDDSAYYNFFPTALFSSDQLTIHDFNRISTTLNGMTPLAFMVALSKVADITPLSSPQKPQVQHELSMILDGEWFMIKWKKTIIPNTAALSDKLDVSILNHQVFEKILQIEDVRSDTRIKYLEGTEGIEGMNRKMANTNNKIGFMLYPISVEDFFHIADNEGVMPPKSTYFTPRIHNGFAVFDFKNFGNYSE